MKYYNKRTSESLLIKNSTCLEIQVSCLCVQIFHEFFGLMKYRYTKTMKVFKVFYVAWVPCIGLYKHCIGLYNYVVILLHGGKLELLKIVV